MNANPFDLDFLENLCVPFMTREATATGRIDEAVIDQVVDDVCSRFGASKADRTALKQRLTYRYAVQMDVGVSVHVAHTPWLDNLRKSAGYTDYFWSRYRDYLALEAKFSNFVLDTLDEATDRIIDLSGDPSRPTPFQRRGLVIGDVQSGKTASYIGICCKAADAGYRVIVLLTGTLESLRKQTQRRLDEGFVGFNTTREALARGAVREAIGVGLINRRAEAQVLTTGVSDFSLQIARQANIKIEGCPFPTLLVTKKNSQNLQNIIRWLRGSVAHGSQLHSPLLVIDDESDNASVNTNSQDDSATRINGQIRELLSNFSRATYLGVTATPFANVFIRHDSDDDLLGDDLFPRDFIYALSPPSNYWGVHRLFGETDAETSNNSIRFVDNSDAENWLPLKHKIDVEVEGLPNTLRSAICSFIVATATRDLREPGSQRPRSMLVNVSRFTRVQDKVRDEVERFRMALLRDATSYALLPVFEQTDAGARLRAEFDSQLGHPLTAEPAVSWQRLKEILPDTLKRIATTAVNSTTGAASLDFAGGKRLIVVGGNSLSRGLTLEGLSTSYFYRKPLASDTLMQMARWFGYRDGYAHLCSVYITPDAQAAFREASETLAELRAEIEEMNQQNRTPKDFGLKVLHHPGRLAITAANKMREAREISTQVTMSGWFHETSRLTIKHGDANKGLIEEFCRPLAAHWEPWLGSEQRRLVSRVPRETIAHLLERYQFHYRDFGLYAAESSSGALVPFIRSGAPRVLEDHPQVCLDHWDVAIVGGGGSPIEFAGIVIKPRVRGYALADQDRSILIGGAKLRVGDREDEAIGLTAAAYEKCKNHNSLLRKDGARALPSGLMFRRQRSRDIGRPLLIIHPIKPLRPEGEGSRHRSIPELVTALSLSFPMFTDSDSGGRVTYKINSVAAQELGFESDLESED